jgi:hypothetical protein
MRRLITLAVSTTWLTLAGVTSALAQDPNYPPDGNGGVAGAGGSQSTAFTGGSEMLPILLFMGFFLVLGTVSVIASRRAKAFASAG